MLANFKNSFENSSLKIKIELYLLPILCLVLLYVVFDDKKIVENENNQNSELLNIENKKFSDSILELSSKIEEIAKNESLLVQKTQNFQEQIIIQAKGKRDNLLKFLENVEYIINIEQEEINGTKEDEHKEEIIVRPDFKINAIVGNNTFINDAWFELNDEVLGYKIETIANDYVILKNNKDIIKLEVNSIEYFKNKN